MCLGFDIPEGEPGANYDSSVYYQPNVIPRPKTIDSGIVDRLLRTKHESWSYEQEVRMFAQLNDPPDENGLNWIGFGPQIVLREVIIGAQCSPEISQRVQEAVKRFGADVACFWAGMRPDAFLLVKQSHPPDWHESVG